MKRLKDPLLQAAIDSYRYTWESGESDQITFMQSLWGSNFSRPAKISGAHFHENGTTIDINFKGQDHVAMYYVVDGKVEFQGFES
jgi:hypothetical protein